MLSAKPLHWRVYYSKSSQIQPVFGRHNTGHCDAYKHWDPDTIREACKAVNDGMSIRRAADVPRPTLHDHITGKVLAGTKSGPSLPELIWLMINKRNWSHFSQVLAYVGIHELLNKLLISYRNLWIRKALMLLSQQVSGSRLKWDIELLYFALMKHTFSDCWCFTSSIGGLFWSIRKNNIVVWFKWTPMFVFLILMSQDSFWILSLQNLQQEEVKIIFQ